MKEETKNKILKVLVKSQKQTASILVEIGTTREGMVDHNSIIIKECPGRAIEDLQAEFAEKLCLSMDECGLNVEVLE